MNRILQLAVGLSWVVGSSLLAEGLPEEKRILFLGDSITYGGRYVALVEAAAIAGHPEVEMTILNLGLSSETVSGLSEEGHAGGRFPRPNLHERLDRVLNMVKPELVFACYGMNCGIYRPLSEERERAYQDGMKQLREKVAAAGARMVHLTPPVFDPVPIPQKVSASGDDLTKFYAGYNDVLEHYAKWLMSKSGNEGWSVLDVHGAMAAALDDQRSRNPLFSFSKDGVHPGEEGHAAMAGPVLRHWGLELTAGGGIDHPHGEEILALVLKKQALLRNAWLTQTGHTRPGVKPGLPLQEAEEQAKALDAEARNLAR